MGDPPTQAEVEAWWQLFHSIGEQLGLEHDELMEDQAHAHGE